MVRDCLVFQLTRGDKRKQSKHPSPPLQDIEINHHLQQFIKSEFLIRICQCFCESKDYLDFTGILVSLTRIETPSRNQSEGQEENILLVSDLSIGSVMPDMSFE
jgi:hypothetical protein